MLSTIVWKTFTLADNFGQSAVSVFPVNIQINNIDSIPQCLFCLAVQLAVNLCVFPFFQSIPPSFPSLSFSLPSLPEGIE